MNIGIFSKLGSSGGSEHRAAEMANGICRHTNHKCFVLSEKGINNKIKSKIDDRVTIVTDIFNKKGYYPDILYKMDSLLVINSDCYSFPRLCYWEGRECWKGKEPRHKVNVDISKIPQMVYLFNFVIKPACKLKTICSKCKDVRIVCANTDYYNQIQSNERYDEVRDLPIMILDSPIDQDSVCQEKSHSKKIRIGRHAKAFCYKFDKENIKLIERINKKYKDKIIWDFMGVPSSYVKELSKFDNVIIREEYSKNINDYLKDLDIMLFFIEWSRDEPWARVVAEGMASGCPVIATNKAGNPDQIRHAENGYLCDSLDDFDKYLSELIDNPQKIKDMGKKSYEFSKEFTTEKVIKKYMDFIK